MSTDLAEKTKEQQPKKVSTGCFIVLAILLIIIPSCFRKSTGSVRETSEYEAWHYATELVKRDLAAPKTAEFPSYHADGVSVESIGKDKFLVRGYVDAQNYFGAKIRRRFETEISFEGKKWYQNSLVWK